MTTQAGFVGKILFFSLILAIIIKYSRNFGSFAPTTATALIIVFLPTVIVVLTLAWQYQKYKREVE